MSKPDFSQMSNRELKRYLIHHRNDEQAWEELTSRPKLNLKQYPPPFDDEGRRIMEQAFRQRFGLPDLDEGEQQRWKTN